MTGQKLEQGQRNSELFNTTTKVVILLLFTTLSNFLACEISQAQESMPMSEYSYTPFDSLFGDRITITSIPLTDAFVLDTTGAVSPPSGSGQFTIEKPDYLQPGPWNTSFTIVSAFGLRVVSIRDHASYEPRMRWINEKYMHMTAWWGRVYGTEGILDLETGDWIILEMMTPQQLLQSMVDAGDSGSEKAKFLRKGHFTLRAESVSNNSNSSSVTYVINSQDGELRSLSNGNICTSSVDNQTTDSIRKALIDLSDSRMSSLAPCKPGPCANCESIQIRVRTETGDESSFVQKRSCLSVDPTLLKVVRILDDLAQRSESGCTGRLQPSIRRSNKN